MDLKSRKLNLIGYLIDVQDEKVISDIESTIIESRKHINHEHMVQFTSEELVSRAEEANRDYLAGRTITQEELESESKKW